LKTLPDWLFRRYALLWKEKKYFLFTFEEALNILKEKNPKLLSKAFFDMKTYGWLEVKELKNKREYKLVNIELIFKKFN